MNFDPFLSRLNVSLHRIIAYAVLARHAIFPPQRLGGKIALRVKTASVKVRRDYFKMS